MIQLTFLHLSLPSPSKYLVLLIIIRTRYRHTMSTMSSPPPTPSKLLPRNASERRFHDSCTPTEWIEQYRPGKFHPIHLGDLLDEARYRIIRKLGYGSFSTVWLAQDEQSKGYVALKILTADASSIETESKILSRSSETVNDHPGKSHVISLLDTFEHKGPNGNHRCLVFEVLGPSVASMVEHLPSNLLDPTAPKTRYQTRYPTWMAKSILRQTLLGIDFLHQAGIAHGDVQPGNLLFPIKDLSQIDENCLIQQCDAESVSEPVRRLDGKVDQWAPRYLALDQPLRNFVYLEKDFAIKISDMGGGMTSLIPLIFRQWLTLNSVLYRQPALQARYPNWPPFS